MIKEYQKNAKERLAQGIPPLPLSAEQTAELVELLKKNKNDNSDLLMHLFQERIPAGVDDAAYILSLIHI